MNIFISLAPLIESQNGGVRRDPWSPPSPAPAEAALPERAAHRHVQGGLNVPRAGDPTASLGSLFPCSGTLTVKKFSLLFRWGSLCCSLCPLPRALSLGTPGKGLAPSS